MKLCVSALSIAKEGMSSQDFSWSWDMLTTGHKEAAIPAALYTLATFLQSVGARNLPLLPYLMLSQAKAIITPVLGMFFLNQKFTRIHWVCFATITAGVILVQTSPANSASTASTSKQPQSQSPILGITAMLLSGFCVALAGIRMEKMLRSKAAFMSRNAQLAWYGWLSASLVYFCRSQRGPPGFFHGYDPLVWGFALLQATGGFIVAWCVALTGTVTKNHAQVVGFLLVSTVPLVLQHDLRIQHVCGCMLAVGALFGYARQTPTPKGKGKQSVQGSAEKADTMV
ncbi:putative nucleotide-sugar transporter [Aspergillus mulundensis]|uniref:UDP-galactose transporter n=1 Tax=Aspergillus mulundensis TaxID=1810919 RepID=A0A3D8REF5_9EURO|nr:hypothetical protein DSM5745_07532 [Aspergillus mulundensis]RDW72360.1 hypothetical protein DSM5745_07532 [Aspergillus mulundensis]